MGSNRALPFGYKMEFGRIVIFPEEAGWVTYLFDQYLLGASYKGLSDEMNGYGVHYDGEKPWNKNMIHQQIRPFGAACVRGMRHPVPKVYMEYQRETADCLALCQPAGLWKKILP